MKTLVFARHLLFANTLPFVFLLAFCLSGCGSGGGMGDGKKDTSLTGDLPGTGAGARTGHDTADSMYNQAPSASDTTRLHAGEVIKVDSTEARGSSRWSESGDVGSTVQPSAMSTLHQNGATQADRTSSQRSRQTLLGSNPANRSRVGQSMRADNPERKGEEIFNK